MTKTEHADLSTAIDLIQSLRTETQLGFQNMRDDLTEVRERQATHLAHHEAHEQAAARATNRSRWAIGIALTSLGSVVAAAIALAKAFQLA